MKVWQVVYESGDGDVQLGLFSTKEKAQAYIDSELVGAPSYTKDYYRIDEEEVQ
jgi:hypothetical protein